MSEGQDMARQLAATFRWHSPVERVERLAGDASSRNYYRVRYADGGTAVVMAHSQSERNEELPFLDVHAFLEALGLPVPKVYAYQPDQGVLLLEDLGDDLLETVTERTDDHGLEQLYSAAVDLLVDLQRRTAESSADCVALYLAFDEAKLIQEMHFFMTHFVRGMCGIEPSASAARALDDFFRAMCRMLASEPRVFAHRDFHARNLILRDERLFMIDFQDARMGPAQYDLASLLRDSYVTLPDRVVEDLIDRYLSSIGDTLGRSASRFRYVFDIMSLQRNTKALGTFGFQASVRGSARYLSAIPRTGAYIARTIADLTDFGPFRSVVEDFISGPAGALASSGESCCG